MCRRSRKKCGNACFLYSFIRMIKIEQFDENSIEIMTKIMGEDVEITDIDRNIDLRYDQIDEKHEK